MSKAELYAEMKRLQGKIRATKDITVRQRYRNRYELARRHFYECRLCADATIETYIDKNGDERERLIRDCGLDKCPYHDYFIDLANGVEDDITKGLKIFLSRY